MGDNAAPEVESDSWCRTTSGDKVSTTFTWTIEDFLSRPEKSGQSMQSSPFTVSGPNEQVTTWRLHMFPKGDEETYGTDHVALFISNFERTREKASLSLSILNETRQKTNSHHFSTEEYLRFTDSGKHSGGFVNFISKEKLQDNPDLLPFGNLTIVCDLTVYGPEATISGSKFPDRNKNNALVDICGKQMNEQVGKLFGEESFSDVKITCGEEIFHCHRCILSVRSPVFAAMFHSDMTENISRTVNIKDIKPEVVKEMLHFIYNGATSTENVTDGLVKELLGAANQYQLNILKTICEEKLCSILEVSNSIELLVLADLYQAPKLRRMGLNLVTRNMDAIVNTDVYKEFNARHPSLTLEITKALVHKGGIKRKRNNND